MLAPTKLAECGFLFRLLRQHTQSLCNTGKNLDDVDLTLVPGIKVSFPGTRHFMVSKKHPLGAKVYAALERGLVVLRERGVISMAYRECGFFNEEYAGWTDLYSSNPQ